jgi:hypothetical protein
MAWGWGLYALKCILRTTPSKFFEFLTPLQRRGIIAAEVFAVFYWKEQ